MAKEPYVKSAVYDMTGGLLPAPADDGYNIVLSVYTPTGPVEKTKVTSQKDFINKYMTGTAMRPDDHMSAIFAYLLLAQNPLYVVRGCPVTFLEGVTSKGNHLLFDKNFNFVPEYFKFKLDSIIDSKDYYYIKCGDYAYTTGNDSELESSEIDGATKVNVSSTKSIDKLVNDLMLKVAENDATFKVLKANDGTIITRKKIEKHSSNIGKFNEVALSGVYKTCDTNTSKVTELNYLAENGTTYYFQGENTHEPTGLTNPVAIASPDGKASMNNKYFMLEVLALTQALFSGSLTISLKDYSTSSDGEFKSTNVEGLTISNKAVKLTKSVGLSKGTIGDYAKVIKATVSTKSNLPSSDLGIGDKYVVTSDESHEGAKYIYTAITTTTFDNGEPFVDIPSSTPVIKMMTASGDQTFVITDEESKDENVIAITADNTVEFLVKVIDYVIAHNTAHYKSDSDASLVIDGSLTYYSNSTTGSLASDVFTVSMDDDDTYTYYYYLSNDKNNASYITYDFLWLRVGNFLYYTGTKPESFSIPAGVTSVQMSKENVNKETFISLLYTNLYTTQSIGMFNNAFVSSSEKLIDFDNEVMSVSSSKVTQNTTEQFAIVQKFPSKDAVFQFSYNKDADDDRIIDITLNFKDGSVVEKWTMSFVPGVADGYGIDQWYTRVNSNNFKVVSLTAEGVEGEVEDSYSSPSFGDKIGVPDYNVQFLKDALSEIPNYEDGVHYDLISDSGIADTGLAKVVESLADELYAWYPASLPESTLNPDDLISFVGAANLKSWQTRMLAAGDRVPVSGFSKPIPGSYKLILQILSMYRNKAIEFAANFDVTHGTVGMSNIIQSWKKADREKLLDYKIETLKGGISDPYYINDNVTAQPSKSYMSEDQNVRMTNTAVHLMEDFVKPFKSEFNTAATRQKVQDGANRSIQDRLFKGKQYTPALYKAVCDDSNNTDAVINANQLVVDLYASFTPSIKYVLVNHYVVPLSQSGNY